MLSMVLVFAENGADGESKGKERIFLPAPQINKQL
jgi:hypothetical protein